MPLNEQSGRCPIGLNFPCNTCELATAQKKMCRTALEHARAAAKHKDAIKNEPGHLTPPGSSGFPYTY